jgi:hypothetical protein
MAACLLMTANTAVAVAHQAFTAPEKSPEVEAAKALRRLGLQAGEKVAVIGNPLPATWARLARLRVIAEIPDATEFWGVPLSTREAVISQLRNSGMVALVTCAPVPTVGHRDMIRLNETPYYVRIIRSSGDRRAAVSGVLTAVQE